MFFRPQSLRRLFQAMSTVVNFAFQFAFNSVSRAKIFFFLIFFQIHSAVMSLIWQFFFSLLTMSVCVLLIFTPHPTHAYFFFLFLWIKIAEFTYSKTGGWLFISTQLFYFHVIELVLLVLFWSAINNFSLLMTSFQQC